MTTEPEDDDRICCDVCGERISGKVHDKDGMWVCGLCLEDIQRDEEKKEVES